MDHTALLSRSQIGELAQIGDDVLAFWLRSDVLLNETEGARKHRRYRLSEAKIATILGEVRQFGANISALKSIAAALREAQRAYSSDWSKIDTWGSDVGWFTGEHAAERRERWHQVMVGADLDDCRGVLLICSEGDTYRVESMSMEPKLPSRSAIAVDLEKTLSAFASTK